MSLYFILNNIHFALEMFGALAFLMVSWLAFDALAIRRDLLTASRAFGFFFLTLWQIFLAFQFQDERLQYLGLGFFIIGLSIVVLNLFLEAPVDKPEFKLILPPIASIALTTNSVITLLFSIITFSSFHQYYKESKVAIRLFALSFLSLSIAYMLALFNDSDTYNILWGVQQIFQFIGFCLLIWWVWQYLSLRIREELVMIFVSVALLISTVATLAFSMINGVRIEALTSDNLNTNAKLFDLTLSNLKENVLSKVSLIANNEKVVQAFDKEGLLLAEETIGELSASMALRSLVVVDRAGGIVISAHASRKNQDISGYGLTKEALSGRPTVTIESSDEDGFLIKAAAPIYIDGKIMGAVIAGYPLDNAFIDNISRITNLQMSVYFGDTVVSSTNFENTSADRIGTKETDTNITNTVLVKGETITASTFINSKPYVSSYIPLLDYENKVVGMISVSKSQHDILDISNQTNRLTLITILAIMLMLVTPFYLLTRRLSEEIH
jgi:hypothetical protein